MSSAIRIADNAKPQQFDRNEVSVETNRQVTSFSTDVKFQFGFKVSRRLRVLNLVLQIPQDLSYQTNVRTSTSKAEDVRPKTSVLSEWLSRPLTLPEMLVLLHQHFNGKTYFSNAECEGGIEIKPHSILAKEQMQYGSDFPVSQPSSALRKPLALMMVTSISMALWFPHRRQSGHL